MAPPQKLLTVPEVAERLSLDRSTVYRMLGHKLPAYRLPSGTVRVAEADLERFLAEHRDEGERRPSEPMIRPRMRRRARRGTFGQALGRLEERDPE